MSMLSLCYEGGRRGTCSGVRDGRPFCAFFFLMHDYCSLSRWIATSGYPCIADSGGARVVRCVSTRAAGSRGYVTCIVPCPALPLVPLHCEYLFSTSFTPPATILR